MEGGKGEFAKGEQGGLAGEGGVCSLFEAHLAVVAKNNRMLYGAARNNAYPHSDTAEGASPCKNRILSRTEVEARRGCDF